MTNLFSRMSRDASVGTTIGTFDAIDTRNGNNILVANAAAILGHYFAGAAADQTTATAVTGRLRYENAGAGIAAGMCDMLVGESHGAGIATQSQGWWSPAEFIPHRWGGQLANTTGNYSFSQAGVEPADNWSVVAGTVNGPGVPGIWPSLVARSYAPDGWISSNGAGVAATTATSLTTMSILSIFRKLVYWRPIQVQDPLPTTTEESVGYVALDTATTTIGNLAPLEVPVPAIGAALLGTLVGGGINGWQPSLPIYAEVGSNANETLDAVLNLTTAITAANSFVPCVGVSR